MSNSQCKFDNQGKVGAVVPARTARTWVKTLALVENIEQGEPG